MFFKPWEVSSQTLNPHHARLRTSLDPPTLIAKPYAIPSSNLGACLDDALGDYMVQARAIAGATIGLGSLNVVVFILRRALLSKEQRIKKFYRKVSAMPFIFVLRNHTHALTSTAAPSTDLCRPPVHTLSQPILSRARSKCFA